MKLKFLEITALVCLFTTMQMSAQSDSTSLTFSGYAETYYAYDLGEPDHHNRPGFIYSHNRHNEFNLNLGYLKAAYAAPNVRANLALAAGTYMNANLAAEPGVLRNIFEANAGVKLSKNSETWVDAGIFASHIGFESAISKDCWTLTRSILAENSPYYESGVKLSHTTADGQWFLSALVLNGWQRIQRVDGNNTPAFGTQITFKPTENITLNSSTFIGSDKPDDVRQMRYFHNFYGIFKLGEQWAATLGFDYGAEQVSKGDSDKNTWYSPVLMLKYAPGGRWSVAGRAEYYADENGVIIATGTPNGFKTLGFSLNLDCAVRDNVLWRIEGRGFSSEDDIFTDKDGAASSGNFFLITSLAVSF
ncbi:MAG: porin [Saprospiraceae bacterium]|nr:porin [Saprospiraceae bacterium]